MKTKHILLTGCMMLALNAIWAQAWDQGGNNIIANTDYLGCDGTSTFPLHLRTIPHLPIHFSTSDTLRMRINPYLPNQTVGKLYTNEDLSGYVGIGEFGTTVVSRPISLLHLDRAGAAVDGWRPWMRTGTLYTVNTDHMYVGTKEENSDRVDAVVAWADNPESISTFGPDALRFIFTQSEVFSTVAGSANGLEIARMIPDTSGNEGYMGIGDYYNVGLQPDERLDVLDRTIRLRDFVDPTLYRNDTLVRVLVADSTDGRVYWRPMSTIDGADCDWTLQGLPGTNSSVSTAYPANPGCPQMPQGVGIGLQIPKAKLDVNHQVYSELDRIAIHALVVPDALLDHFAVDAHCIPNGAAVGNGSYGVRGLSRNGRRTFGVSGRGELTTTQAALGGSVYGVHGVAVKAYNLGSSIVAGVYGNTVVPDTSASNVWGGYFEGKGFLGASAWTYSDADLKTGIEDLATDEALDVVMQLSPKRYTFALEGFPFLSLPAGEQIGLLSQEVEGVLPELVMEIQRPAAFDSTGVEIEPAITFKAMNYDGIIPVLVAAVQAQQGTIDQLKDQLAAMQEALASCCSPSDDGSLMQQPLDSEGEPKNDPAVERLLRIDPNPFTDATTVRYTLERAGRVQLLVNSSDGKQLQVLHEGLASAGDHSYDWNTGHLAPGVYYVTLLLDGAPLVKRAVKVR